MNPQEFALHRAAVVKYGPMELPNLPSAQLRACFVSRLEAFTHPCGTAASIWGPVVALQTLAGTLANVPSDLGRTAPRTAPIHDAWSEVFDARIADNSFQNVWRWLDFLHTLCATASPTSPAERTISWAAQTITLQAIMRFLFACLQLQGYSICYWFNNAGALGMVGNIWALQAEASELPPGTPASQILHFSLLCWSRDMYDTKGQEPSRAKYGEKLMEETSKGTRELSFAVLAHLVRDTAQKSRVTIVYNLLVLLLLARHDPIQKSLLARHSLHITTRALVRVVRPRLAIRDEISDNVVTSSCSYLITCLNSGDGISCVIRALEAGFLPSLLAGLRPMHHEFFPILHNHLPPYLAYLCVVRAAAKALDKIRILGIENRMERRGPLMESWTTFKKVLEHRIELAGETVHLVCANKQCNRIDFTDKCLRYCVGCMIRAYCSSECQVIDWRAGGHRNYCKDTRTRRTEGQKVKLSQEDISFARSVLEGDRLLRSLEVMEIVHRTRTSAVEFDYTVYPMKVRPLSALEAKPSYTLVQLTLPPGKHPHKLHVKYPMPEDLVESVTSRGIF
ncbi:hypothetical protein DFH09DRAFT_1359871 [Mycena vulgaris]|nr:hypothetical protein DFH09DRAFT_1359871 [Mycena vulgaris]